MKTTFIILLTTLIMGITGAQNAQAEQPLKITIIEKCQYVEGSIRINLTGSNFETHDFTAAPINNYEIFTTDYVPNSGIYMTFFAPYVSGAPSWYNVKIYQDSPSNILVNKGFSLSGGSWADYVEPKSTEFTGEQINLYVEVTALW